MKRLRMMISTHLVKWLRVFILLPFLGSLQAEETFELRSPNQRITVTITLDTMLHYSINHNGKMVLDESTIGLEMSDGTILGSYPSLVSKEENWVKEMVATPFYRFSNIEDHYRQLTLNMENDYTIQFRVYNQGVAYRFVIDKQGEVIVKNEIAEFKFDQDYITYMAHTTNDKDPFAMAFQNTYSIKSLSQVDSALVFLPVTVDLREKLKVTITESDLEDYPGMFVRANQSEKTLKGVFAPYPKEFDYYPWRCQQYVTERADFIAKTAGKRSFPWRILAISEDDREMPINNLVYLLASPNRIGDTSWIKPGKSAWEWWNNWGVYHVDFHAGINMETYKYYIDFASRYGLEYVILDEGWYDPKGGDMMTVVPQLDLPELVAYGKSKGVGLVLWTVFNVLDTQLEEACIHYAQMGIKGFKIDFLDRDDQTAVEMTYRIAEETAKHRLFLNLHGYFKPTGINRTYPHIINFEGVFGLEEAKWSSVEKDMPLYNVTFPFIRMMSGPVDYTPGAMQNATKSDFQPIYSNPMSQGTRCHQLATYIVFDSPFTMLCDAPTRYEKEPDYTAFLSSIPVETDETRILSGKLGEYIVSARRYGEIWHVGALTNWTEREVEVKFDFLEDDKKYKATLFKDGLNANRQGSDYSVETLNITSASSLTISLASGGGFAVRIERIV